MEAIGPKFPLRIPDSAATRAPQAPSAPAREPSESATTDATSATAARPPAGEATLWDLLTPEERAFFQQQQQLGPLTYRPDGASRASLGPPTGRRIDVRG